MASATNLTDAQTPKNDAAVAYAKKDNIAVPGADQTDAALTAVETSAAARETDRGTSSFGNSPKHTTSGINYAPDAADYNAFGSERSAP